MKNTAKLLIALATVIITCLHTNAQVSVGVSIRIAPPALPVYDQPFVPGDGYIWVPGYWAYGDDGYFWVPGVWVRPPHYGLLWTPGYWGFNTGYYGWHTGYWGPHVGFYGGINYGFGYSGIGYGGGMWRGNTFRYNTAVTRVNTTIVHNTYVNRTVISNTVINNHNSFNGQGGVNARPNQREQQALREQHVQATSAQLTHETSARSDRSQFATVNHGHPARLAESAVNNNRAENQAENQQNHLTQNNNPKNELPRSQAVPDNNNDHSAIRQQSVNAQNQEVNTNTNNAQTKAERINARNERRQNNPNQAQMNEQRKAQRQQQKAQGIDGQKRNNRGNRHEK